MNSLIDTTKATVPWRVGAALDGETFATIRRRLILDCCKWDPQVGDICTLAPFPLIMSQKDWQEMATLAEQLTAEALTAEAEIFQRPSLLENLGLPRSIRKLLQSGRPLTPAAARVMRFDFHFTPEGWRISEVNSDVPGGFTEASSFTQMMAEHFPGACPTGIPIQRWTDAIVESAGQGGVIALLSAPGYMEDHQIIAYLAKYLRRENCRVQLATPEQIEWRFSRAYLESDWYRGPLDAVVRFYQGEWLSRLSEDIGWSHFFCGGETPVGNPGSAIIPETKRFPLIWDSLETKMPMWRKLLPETCDPREVDWENDETWLVKSALCNTGDTVSVRSQLDEKKWRQVVRDVRRRPEEWLAQKRFEPAWFETPHGPQHCCVGVYTINGRAAGNYTRLTDRPFVDFSATDIALLVEENNG